jgi:C-terminal processing protease CtpA/Prc
MDGNGNKIDDVLSNLKNHKAIIIDIRQNTGGYDDFAARIASAFADGTHFIYTSQTRNGLKHSDFDIISKKYSHKIGNEQFTKPVILLTDRRTISAAEIFILHMKSFAHVTQIGDTTAGAFSTQSMTRFLQNGWYYKYSIQKILTPDAKSLEGIGNAPTLYIRNTPTNIQNNQDVVLEKAIQYLYDVYGIE